MKDLEKLFIVWANNPCEDLELENNVNQGGMIDRYVIWRKPEKEQINAEIKNKQ